MSEFDEKLQAVLARDFPGFERLVKSERLSGGASQETYRIEAIVKGEPKYLAMRRAPGGESVAPSPGHPGLAAEALLMRAALQAVRVCSAACISTKS